MTRETVAHGLAEAFLAGSWDPEDMLTRGTRALGVRRRPWLVELVRWTRLAYPEQPADAPRELAGFLVNSPPLQEEFDRAHEAGRRPPAIRRWTPGESAMGVAPWPVRPLGSVGELAGWLGHTPAELAFFADPRGLARTARDERLRHYRFRWVRTRRGARLLEQPKEHLKDLQRRVLRDVLTPIPPHEAAHGFRTGRSVRTFAAPHAGRGLVVRVDLEGFFTAVTAGRVYAVLRTAGYPEAVAHLLTGLVTTLTPPAVLKEAPEGRDPATRARQRERLRRAHLPQGAPTSPALANLVAHRLDRRVAGLAARFGASYTRYADDLALSGDAGLARAAGSLVDRVGAIAATEGFRLNVAKTTVVTAAGRQRLGGLVVNDRPRVARDEVDRLRAVLHNCARDGPGAQNREGHADFRAHLLGRVAWASAGDPARAARLATALALIDWET